MSRFVWPYFFTLRAGDVTLSKANQQAFTDIRAKEFASSTGNAAVALRWSTWPDLGFPREPFKVFRRQRNTLELKAYRSIQSGSIPVTATAPVTLSILPGGDAASLVIARITVASGSSITVQAIDVYGNAIPNQVLTQTTNANVEFRCPGIAALSITGSGSVGPVDAIGETVYANLPDWAQIQTVGLPFNKGELGSFYDAVPQGFWPNPQTPPTLTGPAAAIERVSITAQLQLSPPATGISDFPLPAWPAPNPSQYVANISSAGNIVSMIGNCLKNTVDSNPANMQYSYAQAATVDGTRQAGVPAASPGSGQPSQVNLPVVSVAMLAVSTDCYAAVGLGYGTIDIPPNADITRVGTSNVSVAVAPATATVAAGKTQQFTATVTGASNTAVVWSVNGVIGGDSTIGTITTAGLYTAAATVPASGPVTVAATSSQDPSKSGLATVTAATSPTTEVMSATPAIIIEPTVLPPADQGSYDYMVTAPFVFPFGLSATLAALSSGQPPVTAPVALTSALSQVYSPLGRDEGAQAAIRVSWNAPAIPQGFGILVSRASNQSEILNEPRPAAVAGYNVFVAFSPANPNPNQPPDLQNPAFSDLQCVLPVAAPAIDNRYLVAGQDVFGEWSGWVETSTSLSPAAVTQPALVNAQFLYSANAGSPPSQTVPATLRINFGWDWQFRAPGQIRFTGKFAPAPATTLNPAYLGGLAMNNTAAIGSAAILTFSYSATPGPDTVDPNAVIPTIDAGHTTDGPVTIVLGSGSPPTPPANPLQAQYQVDITGFELDFQGVQELDFLLYLTATEEVQPGVWSAPTGQPTATGGSPAPPPLFIGKIIRAFNPNPPIVLFNPPSMSWTALPDVTGSARGVLEWEADPNAAGYFVWEATESALLNLLPPGVGTPQAPDDTPYLTRAQTIKQLISQYQDASLQAFARLTETPITGNSAEITLPGFADTLYVYRISAIGPNNVEAPRSESVAVFGVTRRNVPGTPRILLRSVPSSPPGVQVIVLPVESNAPAAGYRLFRVRNQSLSMYASLMGPPKINESSPLWEPYSTTNLAGTTLTGMSVVDTAAIPSWYPYYYRATVIGAQDLTNGLYRGESGYSNTQAGYALPEAPPLILSLHITASATHTSALITLTTDLPAEAVSPVGPALVELLHLVAPGSPPGAPRLEPMVTSAPNEITQQTLTVPVIPPPAPILGRSAPNANGQWTLYIAMAYTSATAGAFEVRLTDPLARQSSASF